MPSSRINRFAIGITLSIFLLNQVHCQKLLWNAGIHSFFDNREYFNSYTIDQTIGGVRPFCMIGLSIDEHNEIEFGLNYLYEFGSTMDTKYTQPIFYYHYETEPVKIYIGSFNRKRLINLPLVLQSDTFQYYSPNLQGIFLEFRRPWGYQNGWIDWISKQGPEKKEAFLIGGTGFLKKGIFFYRHDFIITHYALTGMDTLNEHIRDNGGMNAGIGINLSHKTFLDSLTISTGFTGSYDRTRDIYPFRFYKGSLTEFCAQYKAVGLHSIVYLGTGQMQMVGDALYKAKSYERIDLFWQVLRKGPIKGQVTFSFHFIDARLNYSQSFTVYMDLGGTKNLKSVTNYSDL
jgi:hypothetical protein